MQPSVIVGGGKVNPKHCFSARGIIWLQTDGFGDGCLQTNPWRNNMKEICGEQRAYVCLEIQDAWGRSLIKTPISWYLINQLQKVCCTKWWDLLTSRLRSLRSCHASIIKRLLFVFFFIPPLQLYQIMWSEPPATLERPPVAQYHHWNLSVSAVLRRVLLRVSYQRQL